MMNKLEPSENKNNALITSWLTDYKCQYKVEHFFKKTDYKCQYKVEHLFL